ncbi:alcohol dehydrogenase catalytic domain-containing protein [Pasteurellaceae bacterium LIM206]|nr:alcohol dehydrogenase catalytic domain-containing protein [Pasteurellaceae bacterium LIM206]
MCNTVRAVCLQAPQKVGIKEVPYPTKKVDEVLIKIESMGICGSDIGAYRGTNPLVTYPRVLGHELIGVVLESGIGMPKDIKVGDRVVIEPYVYCGQCYPCSIGRTNCCENLKVLGVHIDGGMQEVMAHPAHLITKVPSNLPIEQLVLAEPLTISLHAVHRTQVKAEEFVTIIGAGAIGLMAALVALAYGATPILVDILDGRLDYAKQIGIPHIINPNKQDDIETIKGITHGRMSEVVIEASGANSAVKNTLKYTSFAGRVALTGWPKSETSLPTNLITFKELNIYGSRTSEGEFKEALELLSSGKLNPNHIISKIIKFEQLPEFIQKQSENPEQFLKVNAIF